MDLDTVINQNSVDHLFQLFALTTFLIFFWFLEGVYRTDKRWLVPIIIFPPSLLLYIIVHWENNRGKCFFASLLFVLMLIIGGIVEFSFVERLFSFFSLVAFWPYYAYAYLAPKIFH